MQVTISDKALATTRRLLECAETWDKYACLLGNVTAGEIVDTCKEILQVADSTGW